MYMMKTINECCAITSLPYSTIRNLCLNNKIKYIKSGVKYYININSLLEYCNGKKEVK